LREDVNKVISVLILKNDKFELDINPAKVLNSYKVAERSFSKDIEVIADTINQRFT
jgi:hypothetical protein